MSTIGSNRGQNAEERPIRQHSLAIRDDLKAYADGELSRLRRWQIRRHLSGCRDCQKEITGLKRVSEEMKNLPQETPRPELRARILASLPDAPPSPARPRRSWHIHSLEPRLVFAGTACALLLIGLSAMAILHTVSHIPATPPQVAQQVPPAPVVAPSIVSPNPSAYAQNQTIATAAMPDPTNGSTEMTDETSRRADEILSAHLDELNRAVRRAREESRRNELIRQHALLEAARTKPEPETTPVRSNSSLLIAVADISVAREKLRSLVQTVGGSLTEQPAGSSAPKAAGDGSQPANNGGDPAGTAPVMSITVPIAEAGHFTSALRVVGATSAWKREGDQPITADAPSPDAALPVAHRPLANRAVVIEQSHNSGTERSQDDNRHRTTTERSAPGTITFTIRLQTSTATSH
jgi:hypothetical protein